MMTPSPPSIPDTVSDTEAPARSTFTVNQGRKADTRSTTDTITPTSAGMRSRASGAGRPAVGDHAPPGAVVPHVGGAGGTLVGGAPHDEGGLATGGGLAHEGAGVGSGADGAGGTSGGAGGVGSHAGAAVAGSGSGSGSGAATGGSAVGAGSTGALTPLDAVAPHSAGSTAVAPASLTCSVQRPPSQ